MRKKRFLLQPDDQHKLNIQLNSNAAKHQNNEGCSVESNMLQF